MLLNYLSNYNIELNIFLLRPQRCWRIRNYKYSVQCLCWNGISISVVRFRSNFQCISLTLSVNPFHESDVSNFKTRRSKYEYVVMHACMHRTEYIYILLYNYYKMYLLSTTVEGSSFQQLSSIGKIVVLMRQHLKNMCSIYLCVYGSTWNSMNQFLELTLYLQNYYGLNSKNSCTGLTNNKWVWFWSSYVHLLMTGQESVENILKMIKIIVNTTGNMIWTSCHGKM